VKAGRYGERVGDPFEGATMDIRNLRFQHHALAMFVAHGLDAVQIEQLAHVNRFTTVLMLDSPSFRNSLRITAAAVNSKT